MAKEHRDEIVETGKVLLEAIKKAAPSANSRGSDAIESLARAFSVVVEAMPNEPADRRTPGR